ncbi:MAG: molecular chaperone DnaK [Gammaproteobacteria bacterium]|nr:molecular chaperone DnaK [Gammaproteobacteria bacterium]NIR88951.1 molecular chaperone DnaK [Gammaproteobacteria bacterium]NIU05240.1 molecular chaperone DnaK [Gammaproteobacteria bacterium]NIV52855.1 molecular chaperone DnaK [Gammaproteobacteria bacterium]NIW85151.1 molecular chaperone DnaK [Gammaproteobacteria bacterium]
MMIIGIDLGTSNSAAAVLRGGRPVLIPSSEGVSLGGKAFPSYVSITADGQMLVGEAARRQAALNPEGTATAFKRRMGRRELVRLRDREFSPEQLSAFLLQKIKRDAEAFLGEPITKVVVTVPAYFDDNQRSATKDACRIAGLEVARLVNEPTAAALAYGLDRLGQELRIAVIDFGGGTLDVTIMEFGAGVFEVKATSGDTRLGGTDMDRRVFDQLVDRFRDQTGVNLVGDIRAEARVREAAEIAKIELSTATTTHVSLPYISAKGGAPLHLDLDLTRAELERLVRPVVEQCRAPMEQALHDAGLEAKDIARIIFVGGPTRMPVVRQYFEDLLGRKAEAGIDPMECVAAGAAIQAGVLAGEEGLGEIVLVDVTPLTLGVETLGGVATPLIGRNTPIPVKRTEAFTTAADMQTSVTIHVFQGERAMAADNVSLGEFNLGGIPPAPRGVPKIEVTFDIDANGMLDVTAKDTATGKSASISISGSTRLPESEKERMVKEAERYAEEDKRRREAAQKLNEAEGLCYEAERMLADFADRLTDEVKVKIERAMKDTREALRKKDAELATQRSGVLKKALKEGGTILYAQTPGAYKAKAGPTPQPEVGEPGEARPTGAGPRGRVVDAKFEEEGS